MRKNRYPLSVIKTDIIIRVVLGVFFNSVLRALFFNIDRVILTVNNSCLTTLYDIINRIHLTSFFLNNDVELELNKLRLTMDAVGKKDKKRAFVLHSEADRQKILYEAVPENTRNATKQALSHINEYIRVKNGGLALTIDDIGDDELPQVMYEFYTDGQYKSGDENSPPERYKNTTLRSIRAGINRHLKQQRGIDLMKDPRFTKSNQMFASVSKSNKKSGNGNVTHKDPITTPDMNRLEVYFRQYTRPSAKILFQFCLFNIMMFGCRRGRENLCLMEKDTFEVSRLS